MTYNKHGTPRNNEQKTYRPLKLTVKQAMKMREATAPKETAEGQGGAWKILVERLLGLEEDLWTTVSVLYLRQSIVLSRMEGRVV